MSASGEPPPFWGSLPPLQGSRRNSVRRSAEISKDDALNPRASGSQRMSVSTMDSTSQIVSPTGSYFPDALAPRPPSFSYQAQDNQDVQTKKRRQRASQDSDRLYSSQPPPQAPEVPDVPHAPPPLSYKPPYNKGTTTSQGPTRSRSTRRSDDPVAAQGDEEVLGGRRDVQPSNRTTERRLAIKDVPKGNTFPRRSQKASMPDDPVAYAGDANARRERRTSSAADIDAKRRDWAPDRSPLQRLELALDSLTKEEKRARAEEAELLARVIPKRTTSISDRAQQEPAPSRSARGIESRPAQIREAAGTYRRSASNPQKSESSQSKEPDILPQSANFRQRAALASGAAAGTMGANGSLGRISSKKIRKEPPGDPWYSRRQEAENTFRDIRPKGFQDSAQDRLVANVDTNDYVDDELPLRKESSPKTEQVLTNRNEASKRFMESIDFVPKASTKVSSAESLGEASEPGHHIHLSNFIPGHHERDRFTPGHGLYLHPQTLKDWRQGSTGFLSASYTNLDARQTEAEKNKAWWEAEDSGKLRSRPPRSMIDRNHDDSNGTVFSDFSSGGDGPAGQMLTSIRVRPVIAPTTFKPPLYLKCGPLLRYKGIRREPETNVVARKKGVTQREIWRGSVLIVTEDLYSDYITPPTLRLFNQPVDLPPPPPAEVDGMIDALAPEYVDPIGGQPKIARDGSTLYVRPVEDIDFGVDLSRNETDAGLFEKQRTANLQRTGFDGSKDPKSSGRGSGKRDGEKVGKYLEVQGTKLDIEQGQCFWRFNIEVELASHQQRIAYRINRGPATAFWVPARGEAMNIMFYSCNGFTLGVDPEPFSGPDPLWRDVLNSHTTRPFHCMIGGGDQLYNDLVTTETELFQKWLHIKNPIAKHNAPFTSEMQLELETFYLNRYCMWFSQGLFGLATSQIPMISIFDDHDIIDGFGSYPDSFMGSPVFMGLGAIAYRFYLLFQHHTIIPEGEQHEPSWIIGERGPWMGEHSRSVYLSLGKSIAFLGLDCRTERKRDEIVSRETYEKVFERCRREIRSGETKHLILLLGIPIAYPRLVWLENLLTSRLMDPIRAAGRMGLFKDFINEFDGGVEILDDLDDHWCAASHKKERNWLIEELQRLAAEKSVRVTILGGDVHLGAIGRFYSNPTLRIPKDNDFRYMPNIISSAIVNEPPPELMADMMNKRNKVHHLNRETDESMIPIFTHDVDSKPRNNKCLLPRRNWCSINVYVPGNSPQSTPPASTFDGSDRQTPSPQLQGGFGRRLDSRGPSYTPDATSRPPLSGGILRKLSISRGRTSSDGNRPSVLTRTLSLSRKDFVPSLFRRNSSKRKPNDGGINGYGAESDESLPSDSQTSITNSVHFSAGRQGHQETSQSDGNIDSPQVHMRGGAGGDEERRMFRRTPTDLARRGAGQSSINLEGGLEITLNVEREQGDPSGITVPYQFLVPALWYDIERDSGHHRRPSALERLRSFGKGRNAQIDR